MWEWAEFVQLTGPALPVFIHARARVDSNMSNHSFDPSDEQDRDALLAMFRRVPIGMLETTAHRLLNATKTTRISRKMVKGEESTGPDTVQEPDYLVQFKTLELIVSQRVGSAPTRKPVEIKARDENGQPSPGMLRAANIRKVKVDIPSAAESAE